MADLFRYTAHPYPWDVYYCFDWETYQDGREHFGLSRQPDTNRPIGQVQHFREQESGDRISIMFIGGAEATIVHECAHVCFEIFNVIGSDPYAGYNEPFCYLLDNMFSTVLRDLRHVSATDKKVQGNDLQANRPGYSDSGSLKGRRTFKWWG